MLIDTIDACTGGGGGETNASANRTVLAKPGGRESDGADWFAGDVVEDEGGGGVGVFLFLPFFLPGVKGVLPS